MKYQLKEQKKEYHGLTQQKDSYLNNIMQGMKKVTSGMYEGSTLEGFVNAIDRDLVKPTIDFMQITYQKPAFATTSQKNNNGLYKTQLGMQILDAKPENYMVFKKGLSKKARRNEKRRTAEEKDKIKKTIRNLKGSKIPQQIRNKAKTLGINVNSLI